MVFIAIHILISFQSIFQYFSTCGFGNALAFKNVTDEYINDVEQSIRQMNVQAVNTLNAEDIYGKFYGKNPENFKFMSGEKLFIKQIVEYVKTTVDKNGENTALSHFKLPTETVDYNYSMPQKSEEKTQNISYFLNKLLHTTQQNAGRKKSGYRYDKDLQLFSTLLRMLSGPLAYQTLQANLVGGLPSLPSINRYIQASHFSITEGILRNEELRSYLIERDCPNFVSVSEDATRIVGRVQYNSRTNQIVGFTLPINRQTGMPIPFSFPARDLTEIIDHFTNANVSGFLNIIMAQPVVKGVPPFCLLLYGTDNKYSAIDVKKRWKHIENELKKVGINVLTFGSDSDPRYNSAMRDLSNLGMKSKIDWFSCGDSISFPIYIQDMTHIMTKLRNLLLRTKWLKKKLPFGNFSIDMLHLYVLLYSFPKDQHQLTESVLNPADRQNFASAERMCDKKVTDLMDKSVERSEGTSFYLKMMRNIMSSYMDSNLTPIQRIRCIWFPVFMLRIWRRYIENNKNYTLKDNFLSLNCYSCVELNAHSLIKLIVHLKTINKPELFLPELYGSQQCESTFRQFRSLSSTYSTVINCTLKEAASRLSKIQLQNEIMHTTSEHYVYPRLNAQHKEYHYNQFELPSVDEIHTEIQNCQKDAFAVAHKFGLIGKQCAKHIECKINSHTAVLSKQKKTQETFIPNRNIEHLDINNIKLKDYSGKLKSIDIHAASPYIEIPRYDATKIIVKKMSLCWLLRQDCPKLSSDRLLRVRQTQKQRLQADCNSKQKPKPKQRKLKQSKIKKRSRKQKKLIVANTIT